MSSFSASRFPTRRRVTQACVACRMRKTRCDAAQPRCGLCETHNIDCVYRDAQQPRVDYNTQVLLERMELLESRVMANHQSTISNHLPDPNEVVADIDVQIALSHTANANHVYSWPFVQQLLRETDGVDPTTSDATDVFFDLCHEDNSIDSSWILPVGDAGCKSHYDKLIEVYFSEVNVFFPLLSATEVQTTLDVIAAEPQAYPEGKHSEYALLLLVLCIASFTAAGHNLIGINSAQQNTEEVEEHDLLWRKAKLLLGHVSSEMSLKAAQCVMIASLYCGAKGDVSQSFHWSHTVAVKCEALACLYTRGTEPIPDSFSRLFWIALIYEGDFVSEVCVTLSSGITKYEDLIPYPTLGPNNGSLDPKEEIVAFQITTNASIRRFLNRVNRTLYDVKEKQRHQRDDAGNQAAWLLRITQALWSHQTAVFSNLPEFLLVSSSNDQTSPAAESPTARLESLLLRGNNPWNIVRLRGRYCSGKYIIHRAFIEYALVNADRLEGHPLKSSILNGCRMCLDGCIGFIRVFDVDPGNSISCLFASGMVTFTMLMIMMISTADPILNHIVPAELEEYIGIGLRNLKRFSNSVVEFKWHLDVLGRLNTARQGRINCMEP